MMKTWIWIALAMASAGIDVRADEAVAAEKVAAGEVAAERPAEEQAVVERLEKSAPRSKYEIWRATGELERLRGETWRLRFGALDSEDERDRYDRIEDRYVPALVIDRLIRWGNMKSLRAYLRHGPKIHPSDLNAGSYRFAAPPLVRAAEHGNAEAVALLLRYPGIDVNARGRWEGVFEPAQWIQERTEIRPPSAIDAAVTGCQDRAAAVLLAHSEVILDSVFRPDVMAWSERAKALRPINCLDPEFVGGEHERACVDSNSRLSLLGQAAKKGCSAEMNQLLYARGVRPTLGDCRYYGQKIPQCAGSGRRRTRSPDSGFFRRAFGTVFLAVMGGPAAVLYGAALGKAAADRR